MTHTSQPTLVANGGAVVSEGGKRQYLAFVLAGEEYAIDVARVQEITGWSTATPIPNTRAFVRGAVNLRGNILPVFDLRLRFGLPAGEDGPATVMVIVSAHGADGERPSVGLVVDGVSDVHDLDDEQLQPPPAGDEDSVTPFVRGLASVGDSMLIVLDLDRLVLDGAIAEAFRQAC